MSVKDWEGFAGRVESLLAVSHPQPTVTVAHASFGDPSPLPDVLLSRLLSVFAVAAKPLKRGLVSRQNLLSHFVPSPQEIERARRAAFFAARSEEIWSVVGKESHAIPPLHDSASSFVFSDKKKADLFAAHFSTLVSCKDAELEAAAKKQLDDLMAVAALAREEPYCITGGDVAACFPFLKTGAPGEDGILSEFIKYAGPSLCESLATLFNSCLKTRSIPHQWLRSVVAPVPKAGKTGLEVADYRPIALLSILFRLFERVLLTLFVDTLHFDENMFGFVQDRGVEEALALAETIRSFFVGRTASVRVGDCLSAPFDVLWGVSQGSVLGPVLFALLTLPLMKELRSRGSGAVPILFADDLLVIFGAGERNTPHSLELAVNGLAPTLRSVESWAAGVGICISVKKTSVCVLGAGANIAITSQPLSLLGKPLKAEYCGFEFLGLRFSRLGDLAPQIDHVIERLRHATLIVKEAPLPPASRRIIADGLGLSHLRFASGIVLPWLLLQKSLLGQVKRAISSLARAVCGTLPSARREDVLREAGFASLDELACGGSARLVATALSVASHPLRQFLGTVIRTSAFALVSGVAKIPWLHSHPLDPLRPSIRVNLLRPSTTDAWPIVWSKAPGGLSKADPEQQLLEANIDRLSAAHSLLAARFPQLARLVIATDGSVAEHRSRAVAISEGQTLYAADAGELACSYRAEAVAMLGAVNALSATAPRAIILLTDSQGLLSALARGPFAANGRIEVAIWVALSRLVASGFRCLLAFVFAHCDFGPNEEADAAAKALLASSPPAYPHTWHVDLARHLATKRSPDKPLPVPLRMKLLRTVPPTLQKMFHQVRTGWVNGVGRLHAAAETVACPRCGAPLDIAHFLSCVVDPPLAVEAFFDKDLWRDACSHLAAALRAHVATQV